MLKERRDETGEVRGPRWVLGLAVLALLTSTCKPAPTPRPTVAAPVPTPELTPRPPEFTPAKVVRIVDGDTARMIVNGTEERVRFIGIDTPERGKPYFDEATRYASAAMNDAEVWLETDIDTRDRFGRLLAYVWLSQPESSSTVEVRAKMFNAKALLDGFALLATFPPNVRYVDMFTGFQQEAREQQRGLWSSP